MIRAQAAAQKINKVEPSKKEGKKEGGWQPFAYVSHDAVTHEAKKVLTANGIHFAPYLQTLTQEENRTRAEVKGVFVNVDNPSEVLEFLGVGYGIDNSDKGPGKALSYAKKYILSQALMLDTAEDIEQSNMPFAPSERAAAVREAEATSEAAIKSWADAFKAALDGCKNSRDLKRIRGENAHMMKSEHVPQVTKDYFIDKITALEGTLE